MTTRRLLFCGLLITAFAAGVRRSPASGWAAVPIGLIGAGVFVMDPMQGHPPGSPEGVVMTGSRHHTAHDLASLPVFFGLPVACVAVAIRLKGWWRLYSSVTAVATLVLFPVYGQAFTDDAANAGLVQRGLIVTGWTRLTLLAVHLIRREDPADQAGPFSDLIRRRRPERA